MLIYSHQILQFISQIKTEIKQILKEETPFQVHRERFSHKTTSYPIHVVIYDHTQTLGYFDPNFYELGFHLRLAHVPRANLSQVIRHELAHYLTLIKYKSTTLLPHGPEFLATCETLGWGKEVAAASICLETTPRAAQESTILRKVQKLMSLGLSSNSHEAEQAMLKSQQLLLKHNLSHTAQDTEEPVVLKRILKRKKADTLLHAITKILSTFFVSCVYSRGSEWLYLEICGRKESVEIAEYVALFLEEKLPALWSLAQREHNLKGLIAKNSFLMGLAQGYCSKVKALERHYTPETTHALINLEKVLLDAKEMIYPHLSHTKTSRRHCSNASKVGKQVGHALNINPALKQQPSSSSSSRPTFLTMK